MSKQMLVCLTLLSLPMAGFANSETDERDAILALMDQAFAAVSSRNPDDM